jgi:hypothetical protein
MIKSFQKYFESIVPITFTDSDQYKSLIKKWGFTSVDIDNYFDELEDDNIYFKFIQGIRDQEDKEKDISTNFSIKVILEFRFNFEKITRNSDGPPPHFLSLDSYNSFLKKQIDVLSKVESSVDRFINGENLKLDSKYVRNIPYYLTQDDRNKEVLITYRLSMEVESDDLKKAIKEFSGLKNPLLDAKDLVVKKIIKSGIPPEFAENLVDIHPEYEDMKDIPIGFHTDGEIRLIAYFNVENGRIDWDNFELKKSIEDFYSGFCQDMLGEDYIQYLENEN